MTPEGWLLTDASSRTIRLESPGELVATADAESWTMAEVVPIAEQKSAAPGPMLSVTPAGAQPGAPYPGRIWLLPRSDVSSPAFDVIEHVGLEKYLVGVVVKEMYQHWPREAFKVQAVCARTYALHERTRRQESRRAFDVESSTRDQAYSGASTNRTAIDAVAATRGVVLAYDGQILRSYYSSTCGGRTASARNTWPTRAGYEYNLLEPIQAHAREHRCQDSPIYTWTVTRTADDLTRRIRAFGQANQQLVRQLAGIHSLEVIESEPTGRPSVYKLIEPGPGGAPGKWYRIKAEDLRLACNTSAPGLAPINGKSRVNSGDMAFKVARPGSTVEIQGRGFGHGVGMCQYCARAMAAGGETWQPMLTTFYPGADIVKAYR
jgi:stage II sporulation protein D